MVGASPLFPTIVHSVLMRARSRTVRRVKTYHDFETKTIRLRSSQREHPIAEPVSNVPPAEGE